MEDEWRKMVGTGISLLMGKERAIDFKVHSLRKKGENTSK